MARVLVLLVFANLFINCVLGRFISYKRSVSIPNHKIVKHRNSSKDATRKIWGVNRDSGNMNRQPVGRQALATLKPDNYYYNEEVYYLPENQFEFVTLPLYSDKEYYNEFFKIIPEYQRMFSNDIGRQVVVPNELNNQTRVKRRRKVAKNKHCTEHEVGKRVVFCERHLLNARESLNFVDSKSIPELIKVTGNPVCRLALEYSLCMDGISRECTALRGAIKYQIEVNIRSEGFDSCPLDLPSIAARISYTWIFLWIFILYSVIIE